MLRNSCQYYGQEEKYRHVRRDKASTAGWYYCGNWRSPTLILITGITVLGQSIRGLEARLWTICGWSSLPTNSWTEASRWGTKFRGNYSPIINCCMSFVGGMERTLFVISGYCEFSNWCWDWYWYPLVLGLIIYCLMDACHQGDTA